MRTSRHKLRGFTLIEVMVVIAILGIILAVAIPSYQSQLRLQSLINQAETFAQKVNEARAAGLKTNQSIYFSAKNTDASGWCYGAKLGSACDCTTANSCKSSYSYSDTTNTITTSFSGLTSNTKYIDPVRALLTPATAITVTFSNSYNQSATVIITPTGEARRSM